MKRIVAVFTLLSSVLIGAQEPGMIEWRYVGADQAHTKYFRRPTKSPPPNVHELEIAWQWEPNEMPMPEIGARPSSFQATPIMLDNVLYISTAYNRVAAIDAETGAELWVCSTRRRTSGRRATASFIGGIAYWRDGDDFRIFINSRDRLYAINGDTGRAVERLRGRTAASR